jgi:hypothetical protein
VLTGITDPALLLAAGPQQRPDLLAEDASGLLRPHPPVTSDGAVWRCGSWAVRPAEGENVLVLERTDPQREGDGPDGNDDGLDGLRALCVAHWSRHPDGGPPARILAADDRAAEALGRWGLGEPPAGG